MRVSHLFFAFAFVACGAPSHTVTPRPSTSTAWLAKPAPVIWPRFAELASLPPVGAPFENAGHAGAGAFAVVRVSPAARPVYEHLVRDSVVPEASLAAVFHSGPGGTPAGPVFVMEKVGGAWRFFRLGRDGSEPAGSGGLSSAAEGCARCHADGVADSLFGLPRPSAGHP